MILVLRYLAFRMWISLCIAVPLCFSLMPLAGALIPGLDPAAGFGILMVLVWAGTGYVMNRIGEAALKRLVREAETWERAGALRLSEAVYLRAVLAVDGFWFSPGRAARAGIRLGGAITRFSLVTGTKNPVFDRAMAEFFLRSPGDREAAALWLRSRVSPTGKDPRSVDLPEPGDQEILDAVAGAHADDPEFVPLLAPVYLAWGRRDYAARRVYSLALKDAQFPDRLGKSIEDLLDGGEMPPVVGKAPDRVLPSRGAPGLAMAVRLLAWKIRSAAAVRTAAAGASRAASAAAGAGRSLVGLAGRLLRSYQASDRLRVRVHRWILGVAGALALVFVAVSMGHLFRPAGSETPVPAMEFRMPRPFTLQVAAYLKKDYAAAYVATLRDKGLDARLDESGGGGKTWYLVRVSAFADRESAQAYGKQLKEDRLIDDFFVDNNR